MRVWIIPMIYVTAAFAFGQVLPRFEVAYFDQDLILGISVSSAQGCLSAAASGMMALTAVVFALAFIMVQFSAVAYSPRLVRMFIGDKTLYHSIGLFSFTFIFAFFALAWVDRNASGKVPGYSTLIVGILLMVSMFLFVRMIQRVVDLQIAPVLRLIGDKGREVIEDCYRPLEERKQGAAPGLRSVEESQLSAVCRTVTYTGYLRIVARLEIDALVREARANDAVVAMTCGVGDSLVDLNTVMRVYGGTSGFSEKNAMRAVHLGPERTIEQDPKYPIRILVDIAIRALSPAVNDPTTAVQAIDQIEDLLRRLIRKDLDSVHIRDSQGDVRLVLLLPSWDDYLALAFDEIRQFGANSIQVLRRLRSALSELADISPTAARADKARRYLKELDLGVEHSQFDSEDKEKAMQEDRQGLGLSRPKGPNSTQAAPI
jgi:uncharacterized membrane protein